MTLITLLEDNCVYQITLQSHRKSKSRKRHASNYLDIMDPVMGQGLWGCSVRISFLRVACWSTIVADIGRDWHILYVLVEDKRTWLSFLIDHIDHVINNLTQKSSTQLCWFLYHTPTIILLASKKRPRSVLVSSQSSTLSNSKSSSVSSSEDSCTPSLQRKHSKRHVCSNTNKVVSKSK